MKKELLEITSQVRALLQDWRTLGVQDLIVPAREVVPENLPPCPLNVTGVDRGGRVLCRQETLEEIHAELDGCRRCPLCKGRSNLVFGVGNPHARVVFVGEAPGREEDEKGEPFVGEAGRLLDRILFAMGLHRNDVYICNVIKCRPPQNRDPHPEEIAACEPYLRRQLAAIAPQVIVALGRFAVQTLVRDQSALGRLRGRWHEYEGIALMPTYHPAYLLRNPAGKREVWEDMKLVLKRLRTES
ncbi:DNA polymerase [Geoalkalibacter ferrihydriticus]|uniref:Type-4 uracil-DNA glycosylase n=1 Tax=Geoalkalibacter ferrihydriticus TaxID=392333 RepID=A0A1G9JZP9_9BACT|nr:uracil-DNA glycosylase [Geoalkalibacter ferrihydriticus]SDL42716.1 DNA polymerase [Geoalkalibacter ferrihydriticus]